jgi:hypothetical protein
MLTIYLHSTYLNINMGCVIGTVFPVRIMFRPNVISTFFLVRIMFNVISTVFPMRIMFNVISTVFTLRIISSIIR